MKTLAAFTAGIALVVGFGLLWSVGTLGRVAAVVIVAAAGIYGISRLILYRPDYSRGAGMLDEMKKSGPLAPLDDSQFAHIADREKEDASAAKHTSPHA